MVVIHGWSLSMDGWAEVFCPAVSDTARMVVIHGWSLFMGGWAAAFCPAVPDTAWMVCYPWMDGQWIYVQVSLIPHG